MDGIASNGRWGGRLTSRPIPHGDATIDALADAARAEVVAAWNARAASERRVADSFDTIRDALTALGAAPALIALAARAVDDEMRHAEICRVVASRIAGSEQPPPPVLPNAVPPHTDAPSDAARHALHVVGQSCFNETFASAVLEALLGAARGPMVRAALRELLADEIDHARVGWGYLAAAPAEIQREVARWLVRLGRANVRMWRTAERIYPADDTLAAQGVATAALIDGALREALRGLVVPGFAQLGLPTAALARWADAGAPTD